MKEFVLSELALEYDRLVLSCLLDHTVLGSSQFFSRQGPLFSSQKYCVKHLHFVNYCNYFICYFKVGLAWFQLWKYLWNFRLQMEISCKVILMFSLQICYQEILVMVEKTICLRLLSYLTEWHKLYCKLSSMITGLTWWWSLEKDSLFYFYQSCS